MRPDTALDPELQSVSLSTGPLTYTITGRGRPIVAIHGMPGTVRDFRWLDAAFAAAQMCLHHADKDNIEPIWIYVERLPRELQVSTAKKLADPKKGGGLLLNSKRLGKWISENQALIMNTMGD